MAKGFSIELKGLQGVINDLKKEGGRIAQDVDDELSAGMVMMERSAKRLAPVGKGTGRLRSSITASRVEFLAWELVAQVDYAAYVEFGTGGKEFVKIPPGLESYAANFQGRGIREVNLPARPFFFPSVFAYNIEIAKGIKDILKREKRI
jgi:phage gpG-like protein